MKVSHLGVVTLASPMSDMTQRMHSPLERNQSAMTKAGL
jgi:hypothetical protein